MHVAGFCRENNGQITARHDWLKLKIANLLEASGYTVAIEVGCLDTTRTQRRVDIVALHQTTDTALAIDVTIRWESNRDVGSEVEVEKEGIYSPCVPDLDHRYPGRRWSVFGLWCGSRGCISSQLVSFFNQFNLPREELVVISEKVLAKTLQIIHYHIYSN